MGLFDWLRGSRRETTGLCVADWNALLRIFPGGHRDIQVMVSAIQEALPDRFKRGQAWEVGTQLNLQARLGTGRSDDRFVEHLRLMKYLMPRTSNISDSERCILINAALSGNHYSSTINNGTTAETAIVIQAENSFDGIEYEYQLLESMLGRRNSSWSVIRRGVSNINDRTYDWFEIEMKDRTLKKLFFDITSFFGK